jgi:hypothetical protein
MDIFNEEYLKLMYEQFRQSTNGNFGDSTLLSSAIQEVFCCSPHTMIYIGCDNISTFQSIFNPKKQIRITDKLSSNCKGVWNRFSNPKFCGLNQASDVLVEQYKLVRLGTEEVDCKTLDEVAGALLQGDQKGASDSKGLVIDVPGSEVDILNSGQNLLSSVEYLVVKSYLPSSKMQNLLLDTENYLKSINYKLTRTVVDDAYTAWSVWTRFMPTTKWCLSVQLSSPSKLAEHLYQLCAAYSIAQERGYEFKMQFLHPAFDRFCNTPEKEFKKIKWHSVVYEDRHNYFTSHLVELQHVMLNSAFQNNRFVYECREQFLSMLNLEHGQDFLLFECLTQRNPEACLVMLDNSEDFVRQSVEEMRQRGAKYFIGCSLEEKKTSDLVDYNMSAEMEMLRKNEWLTLLLFRHFNYLVMDSTCLSQWIRLIRPTLDLEWICPVTYYD